MTFPELLAERTDLSPEQIAEFAAHFELLQRWNAVMNLTRIDNLSEVVDFHYRESIAVARAIPPGIWSVADIGSGAGFPGIPLAILRPECQITLIEAHKRKAVFLREASRNLPNVRVLDTRAESVRNSFDWVVARAVTPVDVLRLPVSEHFALLMSESDLPKLSNPLSVTKFPWGNNRVLAMFHVEHDRIDQTNG